MALFGFSFIKTEAKRRAKIYTAIMSQLFSPSGSGLSLLQQVSSTHHNPDEPYISIEQKNGFGISIEYRENDHCLHFEYESRLGTDKDPKVTSLNVSSQPLNQKKIPLPAGTSIDWNTGLALIIEQGIGIGKIILEHQQHALAIQEETTKRFPKLPIPVALKLHVIKPDIKPKPMFPLPTNGDQFKPEIHVLNPFDSSLPPLAVFAKDTPIDSAVIQIHHELVKAAQSRLETSQEVICENGFQIMNLDELTARGRRMPAMLLNSVDAKIHVAAVYHFDTGNIRLREIKGREGLQTATRLTESLSGVFRGSRDSFSKAFEHIHLAASILRLPEVPAARLSSTPITPVV